MNNHDENERNTTAMPATESVPKPGDFPIGSAKSRAAARAILDHRVADDRAAEELENSRLTEFQKAMSANFTGLKRRVATGLAAVAEERARIFQTPLPSPEEIQRKFAIAREVMRMTDGNARRLRESDPAEWERLAAIAEQNLRLNKEPPK